MAVLADTERETVSAVLTMLRNARRYIMHPDMADSIDLSIALLEPLATVTEEDLQDDAHGVGVTAHADVRGEYDAYLDRAFMAAEYETCGYMRSPAGVRAGYPARRFFTTRNPRAAYASPELMDWFRANGRLLTFAEYKSGVSEGAVRTSGVTEWWERDTTMTERKTGRRRTQAQRRNDRKAVAS